MALGRCFAKSQHIWLQKCSGKLLELLKLMSNLEELILEIGNPVGAAQLVVTISKIPITLKKLKNLEVERRWDVFHVIRALILQHIEAPWYEKIYFGTASLESFFTARSFDFESRSYRKDGTRLSFSAKENRSLWLLL